MIKTHTKTLYLTISSLLCIVGLFYCRRVPVSCQPIEDDDVDVACERRRVLRGDADDDMLKIENLTKVGTICGN